MPHASQTTIPSSRTRYGIQYASWRIDSRFAFHPGFTLVEILIFLLLVFALVSILLTSTGALSISRSTNLAGVASKIASCETEKIRGASFASIPTSATPVAIGAPCNIDLNKLPAPSSATWTITNYNSDSDIKQINIAVTWTESNVTEKIDFVTLRSKYGIGSSSTTAPPTTGYVSNNKNCDNGNFSVNKPNFIENNDVLLMIVAARGSLPTVSGSWIQIETPPSNNTNSTPTPLISSIYYKVANNEPSSYDVSPVTNTTCAGILAFRGVDIASPINAWEPRINPQSYFATANSVTPIAPNTVIAFLAGFSDTLGIVHTEDYDGGTNPPLTHHFKEDDASGDNAGIVGASGIKNEQSPTNDRTVIVADPEELIASNAYLVALKLN